jgi:hypothetical protein
MINSVDDSVCPHDDLANGFIVKLWDHTASFRKLTQTLSVVNQESAKTQGLVGIVD